jgi:hypothetical protein
MDSGLINTDLSEYIGFKVSRLADDRHPPYTSALKKEVEKALKDGAGGTFLWASLMLADLEQTDMDEVRDKLKNLPQGLNETYARILNDNISKERREKAQFLLLNMVAARRPLKKIEIAAAFAVWKKGSALPSQDIYEYTDICSSCSSIIYLDVASNDDDTTVNFCHQSVKDFLLNDHGGTKREWYHASRDSANLLIFQVCWRYLSAEAFDRGNLVVRCESRLGTERLVRPTSEDLQPHFQEYPLLLYASTEWEDHAIASNPALLDMFRINSLKESVLITSYPTLFRRLTIDLENAPTLRDAWLLLAAEEGQEETVALLCRQRANVNIEDEYGATPLSLAAQDGHEAVVKLLLAEKVDADSKDEYGRTPLSRAAERGHEAVIKLLLAEKVDADSKDKYGQTPLSWAAARGHEAVVRLLREYIS